jgi:hypothetical protein
MRMSIFRAVRERSVRVGFAPEVCGAPGLLTKIRSVGKVVQGRANGPFLLPAALRWEVVQLAVHQILDLIILVRVQASQPHLVRVPINR